MSYFPGYTRPDELYHYGVKGMKWGVRRYQDYDGSYTKKGLERFRKAESKYDKAEQRFSTAKGNSDVSGQKVARKDMRKAKKEMSSAYKNLKKARAADEGRDIYRSGETITKNNAKQLLVDVGVTAATPIVAKAVMELTHDYRAGIATIGASVAARNGYYYYLQNRNKKLRSYYGYSNNVNAL